jgi:hypothetical protein
MSQQTYFVLTSECPEGQMLLNDLVAVGPGAGQEWIEGKLFKKPPSVPVRVGISTDYEEAPVILDWVDVPPVMSNRFYEALVASGVDNLQAFDAYIESDDGTKRFEGYKAVNVLGVVSLQSPETKFSPDYPSQLIDTHIDEMKPDVSRVVGLNIFRLAESIGHVVVSGRVKAHLESFNFPYLVFRPLDDLVT